MDGPIEAIRRLSLGRVIAYAGPNIFLSVVALPLALFIPSFYSDDLGLPLAGVGFALAASRLLDVFTDPLIGGLSDHTDSRWGRRKPWVLVGTPLLIVATWMLFVPGDQASLSYLLFWACILYLAFTLVDLPYRSWGAELSTDYTERSRIAAWRDGFAFVGQLMFVVLLLIMTSFDTADAGGQLKIIAVFAGLTAPLLVYFALRWVPETRPDELVGEPLKGWLSMLQLARNPAFLRMLGTGLTVLCGLFIQATLHRIVFAHVIMQPDLIGPMLLMENIVTLLVIPFWLWVADRIGKHRALSLATLWAGLWSLALPFCGVGDGWILVAILVARGSSFATIVLLANSIAADVVDQDTVDTGRQRTGLYFAVWGMINKLAIALGVLLGTQLPALFGFEPSAELHSSTAIFGLMATYGWLAGGLMSLGALVLWNFPITKERQQALRARIAELRRGG